MMSNVGQVRFYDFQCFKETPAFSDFEMTEECAVCVLYYNIIVLYNSHGDAKVACASETGHEKCT